MLLVSRLRSGMHSHGHRSALVFLALFDLASQAHALYAQTRASSRDLHTSHPVFNCCFRLNELAVVRAQGASVHGPVTILLPWSCGDCLATSAYFGWRGTPCPVLSCNVWPW